MGVASEEKFEPTCDTNPVMKEVFGQDYKLCTMNVQSASKIKSIQKDIRSVRRELKKERKVSLTSFSELWPICSSFYEFVVIRS